MHHGDPVRQGGSLVVTDFGDDLPALLAARGQPTVVALHAAFYKPSEMPGIIAGDVHARYAEAYGKRGKGGLSALQFHGVGDR